MKYSFASLGTNILTRRFAGLGQAVPLLSGTFFIWLENIPTHLTDYTSQGISGISSTSEIQNILAASCIGVTPPGGTLNSVDFTGLGGVKWSVAGNIDYGNSVSTKHIEFSKTPILDIFSSWVRMIRDYRLGISDILKEDDQGQGYALSDYSATMYYWTTAPDGLSIEYYACYDNVFPLKDPQDLYSSDIETVGRVDVEVEWRCSYPWHEPWVLQKCQSYASAITASAEAVKAYQRS